MQKKLEYVCVLHITLLLEILHIRAYIVVELHMNMVGRVFSLARSGTFSQVSAWAGFWFGELFEQHRCNHIIFNIGY